MSISELDVLLVAVQQMLQVRSAVQDNTSVPQEELAQAENTLRRAANYRGALADRLRDVTARAGLIDGKGDYAVCGLDELDELILIVCECILARGRVPLADNVVEFPEAQLLQRDCLSNNRILTIRLTHLNKRYKIY